MPDIFGPVNFAREQWLRQNPSPRPGKVGRDRFDPQAEGEDPFVENLRNQNIPWKLMRQQLLNELNKEVTEARLQTRLLR